jgi:hypothetical protein
MVGSKHPTPTPRRKSQECGSGATPKLSLQELAEGILSQQPLLVSQSVSEIGPIEAGRRPPTPLKPQMQKVTPARGQLRQSALAKTAQPTTHEASCQPLAVPSAATGCDRTAPCNDFPCRRPYTDRARIGLPRGSALWPCSRPSLQHNHRHVGILAKRAAGRHPQPSRSGRERLPKRAHGNHGSRAASGPRWWRRGTTDLRSREDRRGRSSGGRRLGAQAR